MLNYNITYDDNNNIILYEDVFFKFSYVATYNNKNQQTSYKDSRGFLRKMVYDNNFNLQQYSEYRVEKNKPKLLKKSIFTYTEDNLVKREESLTYVKEYQYNENNQILLYQKFKNGEIYYMEEYTYTSTGEELSYKNSKNQWRKWKYEDNKVSLKNSFGYEEEREYDENGFQISFHKKDKKGNIYWDKHIKDERGNILYYENSKGDIVDKRV